MKREALVPIDEELQRLITGQQRRTLARWPDGASILFPKINSNLDGTRPYSASTYRQALYRWPRRCDVSDEHGQPVHLTPHQWRHTLGTSSRDKELSLTDVQWVMGHAHLSTTEIYLTPTRDEVIEGVLAHHARQSRVQEAPPPQPAPGYDPQSLSVLFGRPS